VLRDKIQEEQNSPGREKSFIRVMKDKIRKSRKGKVLHRGYEGQGPRVQAGKGLLSGL